MQFNRCRCGESQSWGSIGPTPCFVCEKCGSTLASGPNSHREVVPHRMVATKVETDSGEGTLTRCIWCLKTKRELEDANKKAIDVKRAELESLLLPLGAYFGHGNPYRVVLSLERAEGDTAEARVDSAQQNERIFNERRTKLEDALRAAGFPARALGWEGDYCFILQPEQLGLQTEAFVQPKAVRETAGSPTC